MERTFSFSSEMFYRYKSLVKIRRNDYVKVLKDDQHNFVCKHPTRWQSDVCKNNTNFSPSYAKKSLVLSLIALLLFL